MSGSTWHNGCNSAGSCFKFIVFSYIVPYSFTFAAERRVSSRSRLSFVLMNICHHARPPITSSAGPSLPRIPEGQAEAGSLAAGRLRSLEDQLTRAKQKIHSFQKLTGDGKPGRPSCLHSFNPYFLMKRPWVLWKPPMNKMYYYLLLKALAQTNDVWKSGVRSCRKHGCRYKTKLKAFSFTWESRL